ncbi:MAG: hypothetical protein GF344_08655 [Chitinivibrionales bacterium]|nr:hypothetical protein [Chitinivibrionales bacterium]MBD3356943.1 hypothetical protein [Chitinivibrionales bacterium]
MVLPFEDDYEPDEIFRDGDSEMEYEAGDDELTELDFANPLTAKDRFDDLINEIETPDELFPIA